MTRFRLAASAALLLSSCVVLPIPTPEHGSTSQRPVFDEDVVKQMCPGETSMADVILQYGEPDFVLENDRVLVYSWDRIVAYVVVAVGSYYSGGGEVLPMPREHVLLLQFDDAALLRRCDLVQAVGLNPDGVARAWAKEAPVMR